MRVLFLGDFWLGADGRGFKDALARQPGVVVDEIDFGHYLPYTLDRCLQLLYRPVRSLQIADLERAVLTRIEGFRPDFVLVFKGSPIRADFLGKIAAQGVATACVFPDKSPQQFGPEISEALGLYDLVLSTKHFHPAIWSSAYGYRNRCVHVAHGYDPGCHLVEQPVSEPDFDITMVASWRPFYENMLVGLAKRLADRRLKVAICGGAWEHRKMPTPDGWSFPGPQLGAAYTDWLRRGKIVLAPVETDFSDAVGLETGDEVSARTFQCAAAHVFFIHPRTAQAQSLYDERTEVPMFGDLDELADHVVLYLGDAPLRAEMAARAHRRAVPAYSHDARAEAIARHLRDLKGVARG